MTAFFSSCSNDDNNDDNNFYNVNTGLAFKVTSSGGIDLLNPQNENAYLEENIKIYYLNENGQLDEVYNPNADSPRNFSIVSPEDSDVSFYLFNIGLNIQGETIETGAGLYSLENAITYIKWNEIDTDTIRANFRAGDNFVLLSKAWYNEELIFDEEIEITEANFPEIIKN